MKLLQELYGLYEVYHYALIPFFIFLARVIDVSMSTIRIMFVWAGNKYFATMLGFFEALIWILAIGQIMQDITNASSYLAYAGGFAAGTFTGMCIENKLAYGKSMIRVITKKPATDLISFLKTENLGVTSVKAEGHFGPVHVIYTILSRKQVDRIIEKIRFYNPNAFYTIESVRFVSDTGHGMTKRSMKSLHFQNASKRK